jgi:hypothetical protein
MKYNINNKEYKNKALIKEHYRKILNSRDINTPLGIDDFNDLHALLKHHKEYKEKVGVGIESIQIEYHRDHYTNNLAHYPHFQIYRVDGTNIDFSYISAIKHINNTTTVNNDYVIDVKKAMRFIIKPQIDSFRNETFKIKQYFKCPILNINFSKATFHIYHEPPKYFDFLIFDFLKTNKLKFTDIELEEINGIFSTFKNKKLLKLWFDYHKKNAVLRPVHRAGNLSQKKIKIDWEKL